MFESGLMNAVNWYRGSERCALTRKAPLAAPSTTAVTAGGRVSEDWLSAHSRFHGILLQACPNTRLVRIAESLRDISEVYRCWSVQNATSAARDVDAEHGRIAAAAVEWDADRAVEELRRHIELTTELLIAGQESAHDD